MGAFRTEWNMAVANLSNGGVAKEQMAEILLDKLSESAALKTKIRTYRNHHRDRLSYSPMVQLLERHVEENQMETNNLLRKQAFYTKWFQPIATTPAPEEPCRFWAAGECTRGTSCRFSHTGPGGASKRSKSEGRAGQGNRRDEAADRAVPIETRSLPNDSPKKKGKQKN